VRLPRGRRHRLAVAAPRHPHGLDECTDLRTVNRLPDDQPVPGKELLRLALPLTARDVDPEERQALSSSTVMTLALADATAVLREDV
jgi:hypothetical protein